MGLFGFGKKSTAKSDPNEWKSKINVTFRTRSGYAFLMQDGLGGLFAPGSNEPKHIVRLNRGLTLWDLEYYIYGYLAGNSFISLKALMDAGYVEPGQERDAWRCFKDSFMQESLEELDGRIADTLRAQSALDAVSDAHVSYELDPAVCSLRLIDPNNIYAGIELGPGNDVPQDSKVANISLSTAAMYFVDLYFAVGADHGSNRLVPDAWVNTLIKCGVLKEDTELSVVITEQGEDTLALVNCREAIILTCKQMAESGLYNEIVSDTEADETPS